MVVLRSQLTNLVRQKRGRAERRSGRSRRQVVAVVM
jgi:hypothetical protein